MKYRWISVGLLVACLSFAGVSVAVGQEKPDSEETPAGEKTPDADDQSNPMAELMDSKVKTAWKNVKKALKKKDAAAGEINAIVLAALAEGFKLYDADADAPDKGNKSKKVRNQKDYKAWVALFIKNASAFAKAAKAGDWDAAKKAKGTMGETCGDCHDLYQPEKEEEEEAMD